MLLKTNIIVRAQKPEWLFWHPVFLDSARWVWNCCRDVSALITHCLHIQSPGTCLPGFKELSVGAHRLISRQRARC